MNLFKRKKNVTVDVTPAAVREFVQVAPEDEIMALAKAVGLDHRRDRTVLETMRDTGTRPNLHPLPATPRHTKTGQ